MWARGGLWEKTKTQDYPWKQVFKVKQMGTSLTDNGKWIWKTIEYWKKPSPNPLQRGICTN